MYLISSLGAILILLIHMVISNRYYVIPEDDNNTATTDRHTLQHYINNSVAYFTSNTQLQFLAGTYYLNSSLIVYNVTNFSLVGSHIPVTAVYSQFATVIMNYANNITISNILLAKKHSDEFPLVLIANCSNVVIQDSVFTCYSKDCNLMIADAFKAVTLHNITSDYLIIWHNQSVAHCNITVSNYTGQVTDNRIFAIRIELRQHRYKVNILLSQIKVKLNKGISINCTTCKGSNFIKLEKTTFTGTIPRTNVIFYVRLINCGKKLRNQIANMILLHECHFTEIISTALLYQIHTSQKDFLSRHSIISFTNCKFYKIQSTGILSAKIISNNEFTLWKPRIIINIQNTTLSRLTIAGIVLWTEDADIVLLGPVIFTKIESYGLIDAKNTQIYLYNYIELSLNSVNYFFNIRYLTLKENSRLNISKNIFLIFFLRQDNQMSLYRERNEHAWCVFQYINTQKNTNKNLTFKNYSIVMENNSGKYLIDGRFAVLHCDWIDDSVFMQLNPQEVNKEIIQLVNNTFARDMILNNYICYCTNHQQHNCTIDTLGPVYPGQNYVLNLAVSKALRTDVFIKIDDRPITACKSQTDVVDIRLFPNTCYTITYNIQHKNAKDCEVYIQGTIKTPPQKSIKVISNWKFVDAFRIKIRPCPLGFMLNKIEGICQCDSILSSSIISVNSCNINDQTILRPANSWIVGKTNIDNPYNYQISQRCHLDYCLPHSSYLDLSHPDSQCQFNRAGLLCGECKTGFSAIFGTSKCQECSNYFLLLVFVFASAGIILVMGLFIFNLTVTNGIINGLIFYANIVSINTAVFFQRYQSTKFSYTLVSLINLDLGIEACFYNGMDDYVKMWLQLSFPFYLIFIAVILIIGSRYSTRLQRLTARRALPVLATLFLLSYTKTLRTESSALFLYSTIIDLPSNHTTLVWLLDTKAQIFGLKYTLLFVACIMLFIILLSFNAILLFVKTFIRFKYINHFKPLLDAYMGPYQDNFYYWAGLQLLLRALFFGISALERNTNIMISIIILGIMECIYSKKCPFKSSSKNYQEMLLLLNLQVLFAVSWYTASNTIAVNIMVSLAFIKFMCFMFSKQIQKLSAVKKMGTKMSGCFSFLKSRSADIQHDMELFNKIPEAKYNFKEFQEPLIGQDN